MRISFDYDGTLSKKAYRDIAAIALKDGHDVYVVTARHDDNLDDVKKVADLLGIKRSNIYATNGRDKVDTLLKLKIKLHYDNNQEQVDKIRAAKIKAILAK